MLLQYMLVLIALQEASVICVCVHQHLDRAYMGEAFPSLWERVLLVPSKSIAGAILVAHAASQTLTLAVGGIIFAAGRPLHLEILLVIAWNLGIGLGALWKVISDYNLQPSLRYQNEHLWTNALKLPTWSPTGGVLVSQFFGVFLTSVLGLMCHLTTLAALFLSVFVGGMLLGNGLWNVWRRCLQRHMDH